VLQHNLNLKADKIRRERDKADDEIRRQRERAEKFRQWKARGYMEELIVPEQMQRLNEQMIRETIEAIPDEILEAMEWKYDMGNKQAKQNDHE
jgi:hypothetical protein